MAILDNHEVPFAGGDDEDLFDFTLDDEIGIDGKSNSLFEGVSAPSASVSSSSTAAVGGRGGSLPDIGEEELEWILNKDAFPEVETCFDILSDNLDLFLAHHNSPASVLDNSSSCSNSNTNITDNANGIAIASCYSSFKFPANFAVRARSKRPRMKRKASFVELPDLQNSLPNKRTKNELPPIPNISGGVILGRRCTHCQTDKTPQWRAGPMGPKTLCNACGLRYMSGRLLPEYRPANSPTFTSAVHSNSHKKVVEIRKKREMPVGVRISTNEAADTGYKLGGLW